MTPCGRTRRRPGPAQRAPVPARRGRDAVEAARTRQRLDHEERAAVSNASPAAGRSGVTTRTVPGVDAVQRVVRRKRRRGTYSASSGRWRDGRPRRSPGASRTSWPCRRDDPENRARSIADEQRAVGLEREAARDAEIGGERLDRPIGGDAVHRALEPARDVEPPVGTIAIDVGLTMADENVSRVPFGVTRKIETGTCWPRVPL